MQLLSRLAMSMGNDKSPDRKDTIKSDNFRNLLTSIKANFNDKLNDAGRVSALSALLKIRYTDIELLE